MVGLIAVMLVSQVQPSEIHGAIFAIEDGHAGEKLFAVVRRTARTEAGWMASMEFREPDGTLAVEERVDFDEAGRPKAYRRRQHQTGGRGDITVTGNTIDYRWWDKSGRAHRDRETTDEPLMVGPMMAAYFQLHWPQIRKGKVLRFRILVPDRQTSYAFEFEKVGELIDGEERFAKCELRLAGFLGIFVGDMVFYLDAETGELLRYTGMVLPKVRSGSGWTNVKGMVRYERSAESLARGAGDRRQR